MTADQIAESVCEHCEGRGWVPAEGWSTEHGSESCPFCAPTADDEREELEALATADTLHLLPKEALIATIRDLAGRLLAAHIDGSGVSS